MLKSFSFILQTFHLLKDHHPWRLVRIFILTLFLGAFGGFSIVLLIPLLQLLNIDPGSPPEGPAAYFREIAEKAGFDITIGNILLVYALLLTLSALLQYRKAMLDARYQQTFIYELRKRLFRKIIMAEWQTLNGRSKTNHLQVLTKEVPNLANYYYFYLRLLTTLIMAGAYTAYALVISPGFTLIIIAAGITIFFVLRKFIFRAFHLGEGFVSSYNRLLKYIDDFWQTVKIAKVHSSEQFYYNRFDEANTSLLDLEYRMQRNWSLPQLIQRIAGLLVLVAVVYLGFSTGTMPVSSLVILILLFSRIYPQFVSVNNDLAIIVSNVPSVRLVMQLDEELPDNTLAERRVGENLVLKDSIVLENISFTWPSGEKLFENLDATIRSNTITGITGVSGRGKTTLIDLIAGLQQPSSGRILADGKPPGNDDLHSWRAGLGYLPQDPFFIDGTLRENLVWDSRTDISDIEIMDVLGKVNAVHLVNRFRKGLDAFIANYQFTFSGGECQRLALARVLLRKPSLLLLDEATSSLDQENERAVMEVLAGLKNSVTIIFVTHRKSVSGYFDALIEL